MDHIVQDLPVLVPFLRRHLVIMLRPVHQHRLLCVLEEATAQVSAVVQHRRLDLHVSCTCHPPRCMLLQDTGISDSSNQPWLSVHDRSCKQILGLVIGLRVHLISGCQQLSLWRAKAQPEEGYPTWVPPAKRAECSAPMQKPMAPKFSTWYIPRRPSWSFSMSDRTCSSECRSSQAWRLLRSPLLASFSSFRGGLSLLQQGAVVIELRCTVPTN